MLRSTNGVPSSSLLFLQYYFYLTLYPHKFKWSLMSLNHMKRKLDEKNYKKNYTHHKNAATIPPGLWSQGKRRPLPSLSSTHQIPASSLHSSAHMWVYTLCKKYKNPCTLITSIQFQTSTKKITQILLSYSIVYAKQNVNSYSMERYDCYQECG